MEYKVLYRKYRPQDFDSLVGQDYTKKLLKNSIINDKISHAYIFTGPRGTGKTSSAKIFAKAINCLKPKDGNPCNKCEMCKEFNSNPDIIEIDAASNNGVDEIREIINNVRLAPANSKYKVYIIDEFHMLSTSAFNALLLTLEEPPSNVVFILATTDIQSVPITVLSRCQRFDFKPIDSDSIFERLKFVCKSEKISITDDALKEIAFMSNGGLRDALSMLDQLSSYDSKIDVDMVTSNFGSISTKKLDEFINCFEQHNLSNMLELIDNFEHDGIDTRILIEKIIKRFETVLIDIKSDKYDGNLLFDDIYSMVFELNSILYEMKTNVNPYIFIKIVVLKYFPGNNLNINIAQEIKKEENISQEIKSKSGNVNNDENISQEIISDDNAEVDEKIEDSPTVSEDDIVEKDEVINNTFSNIKISFNIKARINNTFVNPKKTYLTEIKDKWDDFIIYESNANKELMSYIMDTNIVAASDQYAILTNTLDTTNDLLNKNICSLQDDFRLFYGKEYKLVSISDKEWEKQKNLYAQNLKAGYKYEMIDDDIIIEEDDSELDKIANEIFGNNYEVK